jgi:putative membrane protein insertion efficiency factor
MKHICIWLVRLYQKYLSPLKRSPCCRFTPSCSAYAIQAFTKRGFFVGFGLTVWRILRCNPFCAGGYDPVPPKKISKYRRSTGDGADITPQPEENNDEK